MNKRAILPWAIWFFLSASLFLYGAIGFFAQASMAQNKQKAEETKAESAAMAESLSDAHGDDLAQEGASTGPMAEANPGLGGVASGVKDQTGLNINLILSAAGILSLAAGFGVKHLIITKPLSENKFDLCSDSGFGRYLAGMIIVWALTESLGIFGLVSYFIEGDQRTFLLFLGIYAVGMIIHAPREITKPNHLGGGGSTDDPAPKAEVL